MPLTHEQTIPVVSIKDFNSTSIKKRSEFIETVGSALRDVGFFAIDDHGIDSRLIASAYQAAEHLFLLPENIKLKYTGHSLKGGYTRMGGEKAKGHHVPDLKEFWHVRRLDGTEELCDLWPSEVAEFKDIFTALYFQIDEVTQILLRACALYLGEDERFLADMIARGPSVHRIIHYPPVPADAHPASVRAAAHEDINFITVLPEATDGGLELLERDGSWRPIHALKGQMIVDSGDMIQNLTNGYFRATTHRVVNPNNSRSRRFSMPFFAHPRYDVSLDPLASCVAKTGGKKLYPPISAGAYLEQRIKEIKA